MIYYFSGDKDKSSLSSGLAISTHQYVNERLVAPTTHCTLYTTHTLYAPHALYTTHTLYTPHALYTTHTLYTLHALYTTHTHTTHTARTIHNTHTVHTLHALYTTHTLCTYCTHWMDCQHQNIINVFSKA